MNLLNDVRRRQPERESLGRDVKEYRRRGGRITRVPSAPNNRPPKPAWGSDSGRRG